MTGTANAAAPAGKGGTLLLDPKNLVIADAPAGVFPQFDLIDPHLTAGGVAPLELGDERTGGRSTARRPRRAGRRRRPADGDAVGIGVRRHPLGRPSLLARGARARPAARLERRARRARPGSARAVAYAARPAAARPLRRALVRALQCRSQQRRAEGRCGHRVDARQYRPDPDRAVGVSTTGFRASCCPVARSRSRASC